MMPELVEPTDEERRNGWTAETLTAYLAEREQAQSEAVLDRPAPRPRQGKRYNPLRWRR